MRIDPAGLPFIGGALLLSLIAFAFSAFAAAPFLVLAGFFLFFFRDPERQVPSASENVVLSPADGRVLVAGEAEAAAKPPGDWLQISIFLSPMNVHVNRVPVTGRITKVSFQRGKFLPAYHRDAAATNERSEIWIEHGGRFVVARQIVGMLARRVVCRAKPGMEVKAGDRYGVMKFGSRMDIFVPPHARLKVKIGELVRGGETVLAVLD